MIAQRKLRDPYTAQALERAGSAAEPLVISTSADDAAAPGDLWPERMYTVAEVAQILKMSCDWVRRVFAAEPEVLVIQKSSRAKRRYRILRIPESVLERAINRLRRV